MIATRNWRSMHLAVQFTSEREADKVCLVDGEYELRVSWSELRWLESEVIVKITSIIGRFLQNK